MFYCIILHCSTISKYIVLYYFAFLCCLGKISIVSSFFAFYVMCYIVFQCIFTIHSIVFWGIYVCRWARLFSQYMLLLCVTLYSSAFSKYSLVYWVAFLCAGGQYCFHNTFYCNVLYCIPVQFIVSWGFFVRSWARYDISVHRAVKFSLGRDRGGGKRCTSSKLQ